MSDQGQDLDGGTAERLRVLWTAVLGRDDIESDSDFFDLGGDSLTGVELMSKVRTEFGVELDIFALFDHSTLHALGDQIERRAA